MKKEPAALTEADVEFLRARASYLTADQRERFASVLDSKQEPEPGVSNPDAPKSRRAKGE